MNADDQRKICEAIAVSCMWGYDGIGGVIVDELQKAMPTAPTWREIYDVCAVEARENHVGFVEDEAELNRLMARGYHLCNYRPGRIDVFNPKPMNGLYRHIKGQWADELGKMYDPWNYRVYAERAAKK